MLLNDLPWIVLLPVCFRICSLIYFAWHLHLWKKYIRSLGQTVPFLMYKIKSRELVTGFIFLRSVLQQTLKTVSFSIAKALSLCQMGSCELLFLLDDVLWSSSTQIYWKWMEHVQEHSSELWLCGVHGLTGGFGKHRWQRMRREVF